jgi:hypothetical protein
LLSSSFLSLAPHLKKVWADENDNLKLQRRALLRWNNGSPSCVLIVKKAGDAVAAAKMAELGTWLAQNGLRVLAERAVAGTEFDRKFGSFDPEMDDVDLCITLGGALIFVFFSFLGGL